MNTITTAYTKNQTVPVAPLTTTGGPEALIRAPIGDARPSHSRQFGTGRGVELSALSAV